jgi:hypothetical protein
MLRLARPFPLNAFAMNQTLFIHYMIFASGTGAKLTVHVTL